MAKDVKTTKAKGGRAAARWRGVLPAVTTRFDKKDRLDEKAMRASFGRQVEAGVDGLIVCGSLGEASTLEFEEKLEVLRIALDAAGGKIPVLLTVVEGSTARACRMAEAGATAGAAGLMVLPGVPYRSLPHETMAHYRAVAQAGGLPVMVYNNPVGYGVDITPEMFAELADEPLFTAIKESSDDVRRITRLINLTGNRYDLFCGVDNLALEAQAMGAVGWVAGLVCAFPEETVAIWKLAEAGRFAEARAIYRWFEPLLTLDVSPQLVQNIKCVEALVHGGSDRCRAPRIALEGEARKRVEKIVKAALKTRPDLAGLDQAA
jgi:4-hydroxy-tetrahydrodipicolinate synthase